MAIVKKYVLPVLVIMGVVAAYFVIRNKNLFGVGGKLPGPA